jgi:hypothetical protein
VSKDLKKIIKPLIRECLLELFLEMKLESIVEGVVQKQQGTVQAVEQKTVQAQPVRRSTANKRSLMEAIGVDESTWANIYDDTLKYGNSILNERTAPQNGVQQQGSFDDTELVSESALEQAGLLKDYSRFIK